MVIDMHEVREDIPGGDNVVYLRHKHLHWALEYAFGIGSHYSGTGSDSAARMVIQSLAGRNYIKLGAEFPDAHDKQVLLDALDERYHEVSKSLMMLYDAVFKLRQELFVVKKKLSNE